MAIVEGHTVGLQLGFLPCKTRQSYNLVANYNWVVEPDQTHEVLTDESGFKLPE